jgi:hypothetical protein
LVHVLIQTTGYLGPNLVLIYSLYLKIEITKRISHIFIANPTQVWSSSIS